MEGPCTPRKYLAVLTHEISKYDRAEAGRETKRGGGVNIYRLGLLLEAAHKVGDDVQSVQDSPSPEALIALRLALYKHFLRDFPPVKKVADRRGDL